MCRLFYLCLALCLSKRLQPLSVETCAKQYLSYFDVLLKQRSCLKRGDLASPSDPLKTRVDCGWIR